MEEHCIALASGLGPTLDPSERERLAAALHQAATSAEQAWPELDADVRAFAEALAAQLEGKDDPLEALASIRAADLYLAQACARGEPAALRAFEARILPAAAPVLHRRGGSLDRSELQQALREHLLVPRSGRAPRISTYSGRGDLESWVRIAAHRMIVDELRRRSPEADRDPEQLERMPAVASDPELAVLQATYRGAFQEAFLGAFAELTPRERTMLRYRYVEQLEVQQIAAILGLHRVSVSRALRSTREKLLTSLRRDLAERLCIGNTEANSVLRLLRSEIDTSIGHWLRSVGS